MEIATDQTTPGPALQQGFPITTWSVVPLFLLIGTGGYCSNNLVRAHEIGSYTGVHSDQSHQSSKTTGVDIRDQIDLVKASLKMSITDIANCLGVTRQAIYGWISGSSIKDENAVKFNSLVQAAEEIYAAGAQLPPIALRRKLPGGHTLVENIAKGGNGKAEALRLLTMLSVEEQRRQMLAVKFKGRRDPPTSAVDAATTDRET